MIKALDKSDVSTYQSKRVRSHKKIGLLKSIILTNSEPQRGYTRTPGGAYFHKYHSINQFFKGILEAFHRK